MNIKLKTGLAVVLLICLATGPAWYFLSVVPERRAHAEAAEMAGLAAELAPLIRAENPDPKSLPAVRERLRSMATAETPAGELARAAAAFLAGEFRDAGYGFTALTLKYPDNPDLLSFLAANHLRLGNTALAVDFYLDSLTRKSLAGLKGQALSDDQMGLALGLFLMHRPDEAEPQADQARRSRLEALGPEHPDSISAANRLGTILVALRKNGEAEALLKEIYQDAAPAGDDRLAEVLEESKLLLAVIYNQAGRLDELSDFFSQVAAGDRPDGGESLAVASPDVPPITAPEREPAPEPEPVVPEVPAVRPPAITPAQLAEWRGIAQTLAGRNDGLAADLLAKVLAVRLAQDNLSHDNPSLKELRLELAKAYLGDKRYALAEAELRLFPANSQSADFADLSILMASSLEGQDFLKNAALQLQAAADIVDDRLKSQSSGKKTPDPALAGDSLRLHLHLADNLLKQKRDPLEAEIELRSALGRLDKRRVDTYPQTGQVYLRLARLLWAMGRTKDSAVYFHRARTSAESLRQKGLNDEADKALVMETTRLAEKGAQDLAAKRKAPSLISEEKPSGAIPTPDLLRAELAALSALNRLNEFQARLTPVLTEADRLFGTSSPEYMRYFSLKLKSLEEEGRVDDLTRELLAQSKNPPGRNEAEKALNRGSALGYAARVNETAGRLDEAADLYQKALTALEGRTEPPIESRRQMLQFSLTKLSTQAVQPPDAVASSPR